MVLLELLLHTHLAVTCKGHSPVLPVGLSNPGGHMFGAGGEAVHLHVDEDEKNDACNSIPGEYSHPSALDRMP